jgi:glycerol-3-phosphate cytidylyltransferase
MVRGFACGVFDLYHPGHVLMLQECSQHCDHLTIAINRALAFDEGINPGKRAPFFSPEERKLVLQSVRHVDEVIYYDGEEALTQLMEQGNFQVRFLGDDYRGRPITAPHAIAHIHYIDRSHGYSTSGIVERITTRLGQSSGQ